MKMKRNTKRILMVWINILKKENPERAREKARESLVESGVFNSDGTPKKNICD